MEGLELFTPTVSQDGSSSESEEEGNGDSDYHSGRVMSSLGVGESTWRKGSRRGQRSIMVDEEGEDLLNVDDVDDDRDFEIEKVGW